MTQGLPFGANQGFHLQDGAFAQYGKEALRIRDKLAQYLSPNKALRSAGEICDLALRVNQEIGRILQDPLIGKLYDYDGLFFIPKGSGYFYRAFDGLSILRSLTDSKIDVFMAGHNPEKGLEGIMAELSQHEHEVAARRVNWEASCSLGRLPESWPETGAADEPEQSRSGAAEWRQLSAEESVFFKFYEGEMAAQQERSRGKRWLASVMSLLAARFAAAASALLHLFRRRRRLKAAG